ncbi:large conductance mechanosensitive channel protein MscL [Jannaschia sp. R86511]|uniref:large conductance mechanosensitive channel protein MscL n=1 Tax=Jannaschia sp. R86511 TaxID=3093853 RepID=UPI0036D37B60
MVDSWEISVLKGFKDFVLRGNIIELAVAVVIGTAFAALVAGFTENIINPVLAAAGGGGDIPGFGFAILAGDASTFVNVGNVIAAILQFLITAAVVYFVFVLPMNKLSEMRKRNEIPAEDAPAPDIELLTEIRDLLRAQQQQPRL